METQVEEFHRKVAELNEQLPTPTSWWYQMYLWYYRIYYKVLFKVILPIKQWGKR